MDFHPDPSPLQAQRGHRRRSGPGEGVEDEGSPVVWAPGQGPVTFPDKMGVRQRPNDRLVIQIHYNLASERTRGLMDSTTVRLRYADTVERRLQLRHRRWKPGDAAT